MGSLVKDNNPTIEFGRAVCGNLAVSTSKEWLVTNGIGGYASGTIAGILTRRYQGLLVAALQPPLGRTLLAAKLDETADYAGNSFPLFANRWASGVVDPQGFRHIERFFMEGTTPVWVYACADALLEKRIWMHPGANTTYVQYRFTRGNLPLTLSAKALINYRDYHGETQAGWQMQIEPVPQGLKVTAFDGAAPLYILSDRAEIRPRHDWYRGFSYSAEQQRGFAGIEDHLFAGELGMVIQPAGALTLIFSTQPDPDLDGAQAYAQRCGYEQALTAGFTAAPAQIQRLVLAADQFIVSRPAPADPQGRSILAGYPWFGDWGRDTMISLPGLTLTTGRPEAARSILLTFSRFVDQGMLPNRFPDAGETPEYNTVDATLWYFEAVRAYHAVTRDAETLRSLFPVLKDIVAWHQRGTRYHIQVDPEDGLLYAGEAGVQLTWMDARVDGREITPRTGKPVEINALWYNALRSMAGFARSIGEPEEPFQVMADRVQNSFERFWNAQEGFCLDVIDGPDGNDASLRPNQLLAVSLMHSPLAAAQQKAVVDVCARHLLTSFGLRSLAPGSAAYVGQYQGDYHQRDSAYHQGTVWSWWIGPFAAAHLRVYQDPEVARSFLLPLFQNLCDHGLGSISEIFDGDAPFTPNGCIAQAWGVAELLRVWQMVEEVGG